MGSGDLSIPNDQITFGIPPDGKPIVNAATVLRERAGGRMSHHDDGNGRPKRDGLVVFEGAGDI